jgi:hypothetical protein
MKEAEKTKILHEYNKVAAEEGLPLAHSYDKAFRTLDKTYNLKEFVKMRANEHADEDYRQTQEELYKTSEERQELKSNYVKRRQIFIRLLKLFPEEMPDNYTLLR